MRNIIKVLALVLTTTTAFAHTKHKEHHHAEGHAHEHGAGELEVVAEGQKLAIHLTLPWADLLGFEHAPKTAKEKAALQAAEAKLNDPAQLFAIDPVCALESPAKVKMTVNGAHREADAHYTFACTVAPKTVTVNAFAQFPSLHKIRAKMVAGQTQGMNELTPAQRVLNLGK